MKEITVQFTTDKISMHDVTKSAVSNMRIKDLKNEASSKLLQLKDNMVNYLLVFESTKLESLKFHQLLKRNSFELNKLK